VTGSEEPQARLSPAALLPTGVVLGLLVLVWAASTGPVSLFHDSGRRFVFKPPPPPVTPDSTEVPGRTLREVTRDVRPVADLSWLGNLIAVAVLLGVCVGIFLALRALWLRRWRPPEPVEEVEFEVLPDQVVSVLQQDAAARVDAVEQGSPRNGIVACWLRLQEALSDAGLRPAAAETSTEYVVRVLRSLDLDPRATGELAALYREARFSEHELGEEQRVRARAALEVLNRDLDAWRAHA